LTENLNLHVEQRHIIAKFILIFLQELARNQIGKYQVIDLLDGDDIEYIF